jgi:hypothetical protein
LMLIFINQIEMKIFFINIFIMCATC